MVVSTHVERASENCRILAQTVDLWGRNIASGESAENAILALNLVRSLGEQLAGWLLAQDVLRAGGGGEEVGRVRLAVAELLHGERELDAGDSGREVVLQQGETYWVADWAGHGDEGAGVGVEGAARFCGWGEPRVRAAHAEARRIGLRFPGCNTTTSVNVSTCIYLHVFPH